MNRRITYLKEFADEVDVVLGEKLPPKKLKEFMNLIRSVYPWSSEGIKVIEECDPPTHRKPLVIPKKIVAIYEGAGIEEKDWSKHWEYYRLYQKEIRDGYKTMSKPARQDNKTYLNKSPQPFADNKNKIRYPRKVRKTAWKRFYRLFPHLMEKETK